jgi:hypothetical protein
MLGVEFRAQEFQGSRLDALAFVWSENIKRRHLNSSQSAVAEVKRAKLHAEYAAEVEKMKAEAETGRREKTGKARRGETGKQLSPSQKAIEAAKTTTRRARAVGTNRRYLEDEAAGATPPSDGRKKTV